MGLILGVAVAVVAILAASLIVFAAGMSDAQNAAVKVRPKIVATLGIGTLIAAVLAFTHYHPIGW